MNIRQQLEQININTDGKRNELYEQCKVFSGIIKGSLSKKTKGELKQILEGLKKYKEDKNEEYKTFKFGEKEVTLDEEQIKVVKSDINCNLRIIASAGTGKTTTLMCRSKYLIDNYVLPSRILLLTFNVDACQNMIQKANELFGFEINIEIRTIDSFCSSIIWSTKL